MHIRVQLNEILTRNKLLSDSILLKILRDAKLRMGSIKQSSLATSITSRDERSLGLHSYRYTQFAANIQSKNCLAFNIGFQSTGGEHQSTGKLFLPPLVSDQSAKHKSRFGLGLGWQPNLQFIASDSSPIGDCRLSSVASYLQKFGVFSVIWSESGLMVRS